MTLCQSGTKFRKGIQKMDFKEYSGGKFSERVERFTDKEEKRLSRDKAPGSGQTVPKYAAWKVTGREKEQSNQTGVGRSEQPFKDKSVHFFENAENLYEDVKPPEEEEPAVSRVDDKIVVFAEHSWRKHKKAADDLKKAERNAGAETKKLKKELDAERADAAQASSEEEKYFNRSSARFTDPQDAFCDPVEAKFQNPSIDVKEDNLFATDAMTGTRETDLKRKEQINEKSDIRREKETNKSYVGAKNCNRVTVDKGNGLQEEGSGCVTVPVNHSLEQSVDICSLDNKEAMQGHNAPEYGDRFKEKEERLKQARKKEKEAKNRKNKEKRRAASKAAFANVLRTKKNMQNDISDMSGQMSGDIIKDGTGGIIQAADAGLKTAISRNLFELGNSLAGSIMSELLSLTGKIKDYVVKIGAVCSLLLFPLFIVMAIFMLISSSDMGDEYDLNLGGDGYTFTSLSEDDIDRIIAELYETYNQPDLSIYNMSIVQEIVLRYALSKVGYPYSQSYHASLTENIFDCSSLAFRSYREVNISIANGVAYSAAEEARAMVLQEKVVLGNNLIPGDLIFYGGSDNGRYMGIYHVGIYVGNGKMVEARNMRMGVVYGDVRAGNVVLVGRPYS